MFPPFSLRRPNYGPNLLPSNIPMQTLLFSFRLNNIPLVSLSGLFAVLALSSSSSFPSSLFPANSTYSLCTFPFSELLALSLWSALLPLSYSGGGAGRWGGRGGGGVGGVQAAPHIPSAYQSRGPVHSILL